MINRNGRESHFDTLFRQGVIDNYEEGILAIPTEKELSAQYTFSPTHMARMERLLAEAERLEKLRSVAIKAKRCAAVILIGSLVLFGALMTVPEVRAAVKSMIIEKFDQYTKFSSVHDPVEEEPREWAPTYIPEGFTEEKRYGDFGHQMILYLDAEGKILNFSCLDQSASVLVDNEDRQFYEVEEDGITYYIFESEIAGKGNSVIWDKEGYRFTIEGELPVDELLSMASSI